MPTFSQLQRYVLIWRVSAAIVLRLAPVGGILDAVLRPIGCEMNDAFAPAIAALQQELAALEKKAREIKGAINTLSKHAGMEEPYSNLDTEEGVGSITQMRADTFYGKAMGTAAREYLEMRKVSGAGPASPREIYEAMIQGGYQFDTKDENTALVSLRATLRKSSRIFHKLPNGQYGLLAWYPKAKVASSSDDNESETDDTEPKTKAADDQGPSAASASDDASLNDHEEDASNPRHTEVG